MAASKADIGNGNAPDPARAPNNDEEMTDPSHSYSKALLETTPKYTDPTGSLTPISQEVLERARAQVAAYDRMQNHV